MSMTGGSLNNSVVSSFDLNTQAGVLLLLRSLRESALDIEVKNELKDLVLTWQKTKDDELKNLIAEKISAFNVVSPETNITTTVSEVTVETKAAPVSASVLPETQKAQAVVPVDKFNRRTTPSFAPVTVVKAEATLSEPEPMTGVVVPPVEAVKPVSIPVPVVKIEPVVKSEDVVNPVVITPTIPNPNIPTQVTTPVVMSDVDLSVAEGRMDRIREIKADINARVGNPVSLVDIDNTIGRDYMTSLLEAMKLPSTASNIESGRVMEKLELVYKQVLDLLEITNQVKATKTPAEEVKASVLNDNVISDEVPSSIIESSLPVRAQNKPLAIEPLTPINLPKASVDFAVRSKVVEKTNPGVPPVGAPSWGDTDGSVADFVKSTPESINASIVAPDALPTAAVATTEPAITPVSPLQSVPQAYQPENISSVGVGQPPLRSINDLPTAEEVSVREEMSSNPLYTKDVDAGLDQLLSEWSIFKKSGLFGTGPKGKDHPLFVKIAPMQVPLILAGRFEGGSQEIKQSITDYMNGWRYEQGIIYEANETFEVYLRRVIRHIIDLQKVKRRS